MAIDGPKQELEAPVTSANMTLGMKSAFMVKSSIFSYQVSAFVTLKGVQTQPTSGLARGLTIFLI